MDRRIGACNLAVAIVDDPGHFRRRHALAAEDLEERPVIAV